MAFDGLRVLSLESRRASEIETLIRKQGGEPFVAPSVRELPLDQNHTDALRMLEGIEAGRFDLLVLMTGVGLTFWCDVIGEKCSSERAVDALKRVTLLARGPKPSAVLRGMGLQPDITVPEPNTWVQIIETVQNRRERSIAVQEYGRPNGELISGLEKLGAKVEKFALYRWALPEDTKLLEEAARRLAKREVDVVLLTSSVQLEHLLQVAEAWHLGPEILKTLRNDVAVCSIGPVMTAELERHGLSPDVTPSSPRMGALVLAAADQSERVLDRKRSAKARQ